MLPQIVRLSPEDQLHFIKRVAGMLTDVEEPQRLTHSKYRNIAAYL